jgi:hypothetical protein
MSIATDYVELLESRDWEGVSRLLAPDVVYELPQTRERIRGLESFLRFNSEYPGEWHLRVLRSVTEGAWAALWLEVEVAGDYMPACVWLDLSPDGLITKITDFWPEAYEPLSGREHLVERW